MRQNQRINLIAIQKKIGGNFDAQLAIATRAVLDVNNNVQFDPDNLPKSLANLLGSEGAGAAIATAVGNTEATAGFLTALLGTTGAATALGAALEVVNYSVATTGFSITVNANGQDELIALNPAGTLATGTVVFPSDANSRIGQKLRIISEQTQTALTLTTAGLTILGTAVTALTAKTLVSYEKVAASTWLRTA